MGFGWVSWHVLPFFKDVSGLVWAEDSTSICVLKQG